MRAVDAVSRPGRGVAGQMRRHEAGAKFVAQGFGVQIPILISLLVILVAIVASLIATRGQGSRGRPVERMP